MEYIRVTNRKSSQKIEVLHSIKHVLSLVLWSYLSRKTPVLSHINCKRFLNEIKNAALFEIMQPSKFHGVLSCMIKIQGN